MQLSALVEQLKPRAQRLGLVDPQTGFYDADEVSFYAQEAMRYLANCYQLQHFLKIDRELFKTSANVESYTLPANYGLLAPEQTRRSGLSIRDVETTADPSPVSSNLEYYDVARYNLYRSSDTGKPFFFTFADNLMYLQPIPDTIYIVEGITKPAQDGPNVPDPYVQAVQVETLYRMCSDQNKLTPSLADEHTKILRTLVNGEQRTRQKFYSSYERLGFGRHRRWG